MAAKYNKFDQFLTAEIQSEPSYNKLFFQAFMLLWLYFLAEKSNKV